MNLHLLLVLWIAWALLCLAALMFIITRPTTWAALVDRESDYWVRRGWSSKTFAEKMKTLEKGVTMKILLGASLLLSVVVICMLLRSPVQRHFRAAMPPPAPAQRRLPGH